MRQELGGGQACYCSFQLGRFCKFLLLFSYGTSLTEDIRYVAMHTMQEDDPHSISQDSYVNGYTGPRDSSQRSKQSMRDLIASVVGMILPLFLQIGHAH